MGSRPGVQGSAIAAFNPFGCSEMCVVQTRFLFLGLSGSGRGNSSIYNKKFASSVGKNGLVEVVKKVVLNNAISTP